MENDMLFAQYKVIKHTFYNWLCNQAPLLSTPSIYLLLFIQNIPYFYPELEMR